jgi:hypothetical protein
MWQTATSMTRVGSRKFGQNKFQCSAKHKSGESSFTAQEREAD